MSPAQSANTKQELIKVATDLMLEKGWTGFSYKDIAERVGIRKASIHYHFPAKEDLGMAFIAFWREMFKQVHDQLEAEHENVYERLVAMECFMESQFGDSHICPPGILAADFMNLPESMQEETRAWHTEKIATYAKWLADGKKQGSLAFRGDAETQAIVMMSGFQGALQMERTMQNGSFKRFVQHTFEGLKA